MANKPLEEKQLVSCTVDKIVGTTVYVQLDDYPLPGAISFPEIAPGRIRNIRDFAFPGKKIVCKILKIYSNHVELSLRRVKTNEKFEFNELSKKDRSYAAMLKSNLGEKADQITQKIKEQENSLAEFLDSARENNKILEKYFSKEEIEKLSKILTEKKVKETILSKQFLLSTKAPNGIIRIKTILAESAKSVPGVEFTYLAAGKYLARIKAKDLKLADQQLTKMIDILETLAKKNECAFDVIKD